MVAFKGDGNVQLDWKEGRLVLTVTEFNEEGNMEQYQLLVEKGNNSRWKHYLGHAEQDCGIIVAS